MDRSSTPTVSVIMPTYNRANLLPEVIASILGQDYQDLELIIVDDGSTDDTEKVIRTIQEKDERLHYFKLAENKGIGFARQAGLERASGSYVAIADSDDIWLEGKLRAQVEVLDAHPEIDILFGDFWNISHIRNFEVSGFEHSRSGMKHLKVKHIQDDLWIIENGLERGILASNFISPPTMIIRGSLFEKTGGFNPHLMAVDDEFAFRASVLGAKFAYIRRMFTQRHVHPSSSSQQKIKYKQKFLKTLDVCRQVCESNERIDLIEHVDQAIRRIHCALMFEYGEAGERNRVWHSYKKVLHSGFSARIFGFFLISLAGARAISLTIRMREKYVTVHRKRSAKYASQ
jgi:glycosyltransferase involved in cell wall biosynthesis